MRTALPPTFRPVGSPRVHACPCRCLSQTSRVGELQRGEGAASELGAEARPHFSRRDRWPHGAHAKSVQLEVHVLLVEMHERYRTRVVRDAVVVVPALFRQDISILREGILHPGICFCLWQAGQEGCVRPLPFLQLASCSREDVGTRLRPSSHTLTCILRVPLPRRHSACSWCLSR